MWKSIKQKLKPLNCACPIRLQRRSRSRNQPHAPPQPRPEFVHIGENTYYFEWPNCSEEEEGGLARWKRTSRGRRCGSHKDDINAEKIIWDDIREREAIQRHLYKESKKPRNHLVNAEINFIPNHMKIQHKQEIRKKEELSTRNENSSCVDFTSFSSIILVVVLCVRMITDDGKGQGEHIIEDSSNNNNSSKFNEIEHKNSNKIIGKITPCKVKRNEITSFTSFLLLSVLCVKEIEKSGQEQNRDDILPVTSNKTSINNSREQNTSNICDVKPCAVNSNDSGLPKSCYDIIDDGNHDGNLCAARKNVIEPQTHPMQTIASRSIDVTPCPVITNEVGIQTSYNDITDRVDPLTAQENEIEIKVKSKGISNKTTPYSTSSTDSGYKRSSEDITNGNDAASSKSSNVINDDIMPCAKISNDSGLQKSSIDIVDYVNAGTASGKDAALQMSLNVVHDDVTPFASTSNDSGLQKSVDDINDDFTPCTANESKFQKSSNAFHDDVTSCVAKGINSGRRHSSQC